MPTNPDTLFKAILSGEYDDHLSGITNCVKNRKDALDGVLRYSLKPGDTVRFTDKVRPRYLAGLRAIVLGKGTKNIQVRIVDEDAGKAGRFSDWPFSTPVNLLERAS